MKYLVTNICYARTGSNYFSQLLDYSFPNINAHYELFNKQQCYMNEKYIERASETFNTENSSNFKIKNFIVYKLGQN